jgi:predicted NUDIX family phosphoesterase
VTDERVLVVPRDRIMGPLAWRGMLGGGAAPYLDAIAEAGRFEPRSAMEADPRFKQVIPYLVLRDRDRYFLMRRTRAGGDERLHDRFSIGVGGHLNPGDVDLQGGLAREWAEELVADFVPEFRLVGLLNDDETDVGRVHLGVVYVADAAGRPVEVRETDKLEGQFAGAARRLRPDGDVEPAGLRLRQRPGGRRQRRPAGDPARGAANRARGAADRARGAARVLTLGTSGRPGTG